MASASMSKLRKLAAAASVLAVCGGALTACGSSQSSNGTEVRSRRADLAEVAHALLARREAVAQEVAAARLAWPLLDGGIPHASAPRHETAHQTRDARARRREHALQARRERELNQRLAALRQLIALARVRAQEIYAPLVAHGEELTGAASGISSVYELASGLVDHGLAQVDATLNVRPSTPPAARAFLRENVDTYIISVYDGNFDLSLLGKMIERAYERLGGPKEFRAMLTKAQVKELARAYSPAGVRLEPHPWEGLVGS
jgi:hypothetical protein